METRRASRAFWKPFLLEYGMGYSPYKEQVIEYVKNNPGCCKFDVAKRVSFGRNPSLSYGIVNTAIKNKWIFAYQFRSGRYSLFSTLDELIANKLLDKHLLNELYPDANFSSI